MAKSKGTKNSQADAKLRKVGYLDVNIQSCTKDRKKLEVVEKMSEIDRDREISS